MKRPVISGLLFALLLALPAIAQEAPRAREPEPYLPGRDVAWVPTPQVLIDRMLDMARLTPDDRVVDLGSGDGRTVIAAAKRGARSRGVEFNSELLELSKRRAAEAGVAGMATFTQGDMYQADISDATVLPLFLMTENLEELLPKFLALPPGTRIVNNGFEFNRWDYDEVALLDGEACGKWCIAYLYIVPARVAGLWRTDQGDLELQQDFQWISGTLTTKRGERIAIERGRVQGDVIRFTAGKLRYTARVTGDTIAGQLSGDYMLRWSGRR